MNTIQNKVMAFAGYWEPDVARVPVLDCKYHALPLNHAEFLACVHEALPARPFVEVVSGKRSPYVIPTLLRSRHDGKISLHVLNYRTGERVESLTLRLHLGDVVNAGSAKCISPEWANEIPIALTKGTDAMTLTLPAFQIYAGVLLEG